MNVKRSNPNFRNYIGWFLSMDQLWTNEDVKIAPGRSTDSGDASWDNRWMEKVVKQSTIGGVAGEPEK